MSKITKALIYCRVSSIKQSTEGHGLDSQESRCTEYATSKGYKTVKVFRDSFTGGGNFLDRPAMSQLLKFLENNPDEYVVVFDDLKRFARDLIFHFTLKRELNSRGAKIECLNFNFEDTPEGEFVEAVMAAQNELERKQNRRQVIQKMKARQMAGYWVSRPPTGYKTSKNAIHGRLLIKDETYWDVTQKALEGFASGEFDSVYEIKNYLLSQDFKFPNAKELKMSLIRDMLTRVVYTGHILVDNRLIKAHHEPMISLERHNQILNRLTNKVNQVKEFSNLKHLNEFFIRGIVCCSGCKTALTGSFSKGKSKYYGYYHCKNHECDEFGKTRGYGKNFIEQSYLNQLGELCFDLEQSSLAYQNIMDKYSLYSENNKQNTSTECEIIELDLQIKNLCDRIAKTTNDTLAKNYENSILELEEKKLQLQSAQTKNIIPIEKVGTPLKTILNFLENLRNIAQSGNIDKIKQASKLVLNSVWYFNRKNQVGTPDLSFIYKKISLFGRVNASMVDLTEQILNRFESIVDIVWRFGEKIASLKLVS